MTNGSNRPKSKVIDDAEVSDTIGLLNDDFESADQPGRSNSAPVTQPIDDPLFDHMPLLETSRTKWQYGEWTDLASISLSSIKDHPDRAKIVLLVGAAKAQLGEKDQARALFRQAKVWGCSRELIARVLASMIHNSLGRMAVSLEDDDAAARHFEEALTLVEPKADAPLMARTRRVRETARMGLLTDAAKILGEDFSATQAAPVENAARLASMQNELSLINQELSQFSIPTPQSAQEANNHPIFAKFASVPCKTSGFHVYDFLGGATRVAYNHNWAAHATPADTTTTPKLPKHNEHYFDWIAVLTAAANAQGVFRMAELGAGWAPWLVRGALAANQRSDITSKELLAIEADPTHFNWALEHFSDNGMDPNQHYLLHGAVSVDARMHRFPVVNAPDADYSTSLLDAATAPETIEVQGFTIPALLQRFSGPLDLLHVDIQGTEYEVLPPAIDILSQSVRAIMIGTHDDDDQHNGLAAIFRENGWQERLNYGRSRRNETPWGRIATDDGFLWFENAKSL